MKEKTIFMMWFFIFLLVGVIATSQPALGTFKQRQEVTLVQLCGECSFNNITSVTAPDSTEVVANVVMTKDGTKYTYVLDAGNTSQIGTYNVNGFGDLNGNDNEVWTYTFEITPSGFVNNPTYYIIFFLFVIGLIVLGFYIQDNWVIVFGGIGITLLGLYILFFGIVGLKDVAYTWAIGLILLGLGMYFSVRGAWEALYA
jgi:hypothetical protein